MRIFYPGLDPETDPKLKRELRLDQLEAIWTIVRELTEPHRTKSVLCGAGMGSGKTVVCAEVVRHTSPKRLLVVGVKLAYKQWKDCFTEQGISTPLLRIDNTTVAGRDNLARLTDGDPGYFYIGLEMLRAQDWEEVSETWDIGKELAEEFGTDQTGEQLVKKQKHTYSKMPPIDLLISDEAHKHASQKSAAIKTMTDIPTKAKIALSGTFYGNKFENAWTVATWLWGKPIIGTKGQFELHYCVKIALKKKDGTPIRTPGGWPLSKIIGERNAGEYVETLPCYVFIATPIGPPPHPEVVKVPLRKEQRRQYDEMEDQSLTWIPSSRSTKREPLIADLPITQRIRLRTAALGAMTLTPNSDPDKGDTITFAANCESSTLDALYEVMHRPEWLGQKVLVLTHSKPFAEEAARRIGQKIPTFLKTGDTVEKKWELDKASFALPVSETGQQVMVAVISAVGTAMDGLQFGCSKVAWLSLDENNVNNIQASNRIWRDGVDIDSYAAVQLVQEGTIAEGILSKTRTHRRSILDSVQGDR